MADEYLTVATLPSRPSPGDLLAFFNIPPDSIEHLDDNIARKRRHWHCLAASSPAGRQKAQRVKELIGVAAAAIKRGAEMPINGAEAATQPAPQSPPARPRTIEDVWAELEELLFGGRITDALALATSARSTWPADPKAHQAFAWCVAGILVEREVAPSLYAEAVEAIRFAMARNGTDPSTWTTLVRLQLGTRRNEDALAALVEAEQRLGQLDQRLITARCVARLRLGKTVEGLADAVTAVNANGDTAVRSDVARTVLREAVSPLLPLQSNKDVDAYSRAVEVAAWCAQGAPEAEDQVRPHRLWAARAGQRVYTGSWTTRSLVAVLTLFTALPFYNRFRSRPCYQVFLEGPSLMNPLWRYVAEPDFVRSAHAAAGERLPWVSFGGRWPTA